MKHYVTVLTILALAAGGNMAIRMSQAAAVEQSRTEYVLTVPEYIGDFQQQGADAEVSERVQRVLETSNILIRNYTDRRGWPVQLTIVHAGATRRSLHFPEVCIVGAGWEIREQTVHPVGITFNARRLVLVRGDEQEAVLYWFKTGDNLTGNFFLNSLNWTVNQFTAGSSTSAMIRVSTKIPPGREQAAFSVLDDFARQATPVLMETVP